ncbi:MAG: hypothetical protein C0524_13100 [Rhodobacter sp.]|nr:hypothetical protein [Rhodobacter sp.]
MGRVAEVLALWHGQGRARRDVNRQAAAQVQAPETRIREMEEMTASLAHLVQACAGDNRPACPILADPGGAKGKGQDRQAGQTFDQPPSITCGTPVVNEDSSDAR